MVNVFWLEQEYLHSHIYVYSTVMFGKCIYYTSSARRRIPSKSVSLDSSVLFCFIVLWLCFSFGK